MIAAIARAEGRSGSVSARPRQVERDRLHATIRDLSLACQKRAEERSKAETQVAIVVMRESEARENIATALGMVDGWELSWPEIIARANELRTTLRLRSSSPDTTGAL